MPSCSDGRRVEPPMAAAATWSKDTPLRTPAPSVFVMRALVRNEPVPRAWSPAPSLEPM